MNSRCYSFCLVVVILFLVSCVPPSTPGAGTPLAMTSTESLQVATSTTQTSFILPTATGTATLRPSSTPTPSRRISLQAVGDIMLARTVGDLILQQGPQAVFTGVQAVLEDADILVGNLECAITGSGQPQDKAFNFAAPPESARSLSLAGFDVLSLANNHAMDFGAPALLNTIETLAQAGVAAVGAGRNALDARSPVVLERNGLRLAFLAYADVPVEKGGFDTRTWIATSTQPGIAWADLEQIKTDVAAAKQAADLVIVLLHSGFEINSYIPPISTDQRAEAQAAIDAGASLVIGAHSHVLQRIEEYHGGLIAFSLGNFVFDGYQGIVNATIILQVELSAAGVESYTWVPVLIENGLPTLSSDQAVPAIGTMIAP